ncbi:hypothetical protein [Pseudovibrio sp. SPO723]|uniref:MotE family protein n=1 Tax=Nesiotobacter zosterae TaxID=392721 RepID=UPI0029C50FDF|nr:hypothetical protein [Pseudovibrio sp. SPO723]MDX5593665.1 hypothetical protein [Pseudovibrio sp. SPO723]
MAFSRKSLNLTGVCAAAVLALTLSVSAQEAEMSEKQQQQSIEDALNYCQNVSEDADAARMKWQLRAMFDAEEQMNAKIIELDAKIEELRNWVERREQILQRAEGHVVEIYAKMRSEAAATQLSTLDDITAVSVLMQLKPRQAGAILAEMPAERAAYLTDTMALLTQKYKKGADS